MQGLGKRTTVGVAILFAVARAASGAGFALFEHSGRGLGSAFAGEAAVAEDASTVYFNPAGLTLLAGTQIATSGFAIIPSAEFHNQGSHLNPVVGGGLLRGGDGGDAGSLALVPTFFVAHELTSRIHLGFGVSAPFGLSTEYEHGWVGRYHAVSSSFETINLNPSIAVRLTDWVSVGGGADIEYAKARLTNNLDMGAICQIFGARQDPVVPPQFCTDVLGLQPQGTDGFVRVKGEDWNAGYNFGLLFTPSKSWRVGLAYRSMLHHTLDGRATFGVPKKAEILRKVSGALFDTGGKAGVDLPERVSLSAFQQLTPAWAILSDITWTHWARFEELVFEFDNPKQPTIHQPEGWRDSFRYSFGVRWTPWQRWAFRLGSAYDEGTIPNETLRTPRIPDTDRVWATTGIGYRPFDRVALAVSYAHLFALEKRIDNADPVTGHVIRGRYTGSANIVGVQLTYDIGWPPLSK